MNILSFDINVNKGKQKTPSGTPCGAFCFPWGKQKTPGVLLCLLQYSFQFIRQAMISRIF